MSLEINFDTQFCMDSIYLLFHALVWRVESWHSMPLVMHPGNYRYTGEIAPTTEFCKAWGTIYWECHLRPGTEGPHTKPDPTAMEGRRLRRVADDLRRVEKQMRVKVPTAPSPREVRTQRGKDSM